MSEFYQTRMGHRFYESTMPALVKQLERLNELLERLAKSAVANERDEQCRSRQRYGT